MRDDSPALCVAEGRRQREVDPLDGGRCVPEAQEFLDEGIDVVGAEGPDFDAPEDRPDLFRAGTVRVDAVRPAAGLPFAGIDPLVHGLFNRLGRLRRLLREETFSGAPGLTGGGVDDPPALLPLDEPLTAARVPLGASVATPLSDGGHVDADSTCGDRRRTVGSEITDDKRDLSPPLEELVLRRSYVSGDSGPVGGQPANSHRYRDRTMPSKWTFHGERYFTVLNGSRRAADSQDVQEAQPLGAYSVTADRSHGECCCSECETGWAAAWAAWAMARG